MKNLETERLLLRKITLDDAEDLFNNWASDLNTTKFLTFKTHKTKDETIAFINNWVKKYERGGFEWAVELKENHQIIGMISADKTYKYKCLEIGYSISSKYWNQGLTTEAVNKIIKYLLWECDFNIVETIIPSDNIGSIKVAEKCGLTLEATLKNRYKDKDNNIQNLLIYSIFKESITNLYLKEPTLEDKEAVIEMCKEFENSNDEYKFEGASNIKNILSDSYEKYLEKCEIDKKIESINPNWSNANNYLLVDENNHIYGCSQFRHHILGDLINVGGNFAYAIRPSKRGKGYGTIQLKLLLEKAKEIGLDKVLVTCRENNIGSKRTMKKFIGEADTLVPSMHDGIMEYRYWIDINENIKNNSENAADNLRNFYLKFPTLEDKNEYIKYQKEEHNIDLNYEQWLDDKIKSSSQVENIDGKVPRTILLLTDGKEIFGQVSIRYNIEEVNLKKYIGHIGYEIRKKYRNNGYGNLILKLAIEKCYQLGLREIMISCKTDNIASAKVIENNDGIFSHKIYIDEEKSEFNIYWIKIN